MVESPPGEDTLNRSGQCIYNYLAIVLVSEYF